MFVINKILVKKEDKVKKESKADKQKVSGYVKEQHLFLHHCLAKMHRSKAFKLQMIQ